MSFARCELAVCLVTPASQRKLARRQRGAVQERRQHVGARGIADQRGGARNAGSHFHGSMIVEPSRRRNGLGSLRDNRGTAMITCFIRYEIDPFGKARRTRLTPQPGARSSRAAARELIGYFAPHEGSATTAYAAYNVESLAAYEAYRARLAADAKARENFEFARTHAFIRSEDRIFLRLASAPHAELIRR